MVHDGRDFLFMKSIVDVVKWMLLAEQTECTIVSTWLREWQSEEIILCTQVYYNDKL